MSALKKVSEQTSRNIHLYSYCNMSVRMHIYVHVYSYRFGELLTGLFVFECFFLVLLTYILGLLPSLEKLLSGLQQCQAALVKYVEEQRLKCPWFYMLPLEDILQFVCYGKNRNHTYMYMHLILSPQYASTFVTHSLFI